MERIKKESALDNSKNSRGSAKKSKEKEDETKKVVAKCDYPEEVVTNCDNPDEVIANCENPQETSLSQYDIEKMIFTIRGMQVMIDRDLASVYGVTTSQLNQQPEQIFATGCVWDAWTYVSDLVKTEKQL